MVSKHPWEGLKTEVPEPGDTGEEAENYPELPDAAPASELPADDNDVEEDMS